MNPVKIVTDSTADLDKDLLASLDIEVLPLLVNFGEESFRDGIDITTEELYKKVEETRELPKTSAVGPGEFINFFEKWIGKGYDVVYVGIGSTLSGTFRAANVAKLDFPEDRIYLIDSKNLSSGSGLLVLKASDFAKQGLSAKEISEKLNEFVPKIRSQFAIKVLDYLHKGGRASGTQALVGKFLRIRPIIKVIDGKLEVYKKPMGTMRKAVDIMLEEYFLEGNNVDLDYVMITHSLADNHAEYMKEQVLEKLKPKNLLITNAGCVISSHCGEGTIGILYIVKE